MVTRQAETFVRYGLESAELRRGNRVCERAPIAMGGCRSQVIRIVASRLLMIHRRMKRRSLGWALALFKT